MREANRNSSAINLTRGGRGAAPIALAKLPRSGTNCLREAASPRLVVSIFITFGDAILAWTWSNFLSAMGDIKTLGAQMQLVLAIILGGLFGGALLQGGGVLVGAVVGWLLARSLQQGRQVRELQAALKDLQAQPASATTAVPAGAALKDLQMRPASATTPVPAGAASATPVGGDYGAPAGAADVAPAEAELLAATSTDFPAAPASTDTDMALPAGQAAAAAYTARAQTAEPRAPAPPLAARSEPPTPPFAPEPDLLAPIKAWLLGGNTIVKVGVGILFVGLAFLAKFASEHARLPVEFRLAGIAAVAVVLLVVGWRLRLRRPDYAQVLQGGAVAVLYLTLFVAFRFFGVLAVGPVFALMVVVAALAAALAVLQNARVLAVIGALGGFATPLLISTGSGDHVALFAYYLVLDLGIAAVGWHRTWRSLNLIGFLGTFIVATAWGVLKYQPEHYASSQAFLIAFFLLFVAVMLMPTRMQDRQAGADTGPVDQWVQGALLFGVPTITFVLQHGLVRDTEYGTAISALLLAAFYVALAAWMRQRPRLAVGFEASLAIGTVFLTLVIPFALDARSTSGAWALEGAGLVWLGLRQSRGAPRLFGYALLLLAGGAMVFAHGRHGIPSAIFNAYFFNGLMAAAASLAAAWFVSRRALPAAARAGSLASHEGLAEPLLIAWGTLWLLSAVGLQIDSFVSTRLVTAAWLATFSGIALLYTLLAVRLDWQRIGLPVAAHAPLHLLGAVAAAAVLARPLQDGGWWAWPAALLAHGVVLWRLAPQWPALVRDLVHAIGVLVLAVVGALQGRAVTADWGDAASAWPWLGWLVVPAALLMVLPRPSSAQRWPVRGAPVAYQWLASLVLTAGLLLWTLLANVASDGSAKPLPHLPLLNPLDLGVGVALLACWWWLGSAVARRGLNDAPAVPAAVLGVAGFVWVNAMLIRAFHHYGGVPYQVDQWSHSLAVQTGITLLWTLGALVLMWLSARRTMRLPWMVGAALLAAVVLKLFLVDLSGSGTVTRIVSFIGVGLLMLVIGYVAPPPSEGDRHVAT